MESSRSKSCKKCEHWVHNGAELVCSTCGKPISWANSNPEVDFSENEENEFQARYEKEDAEKRYELWKAAEGLSNPSQKSQNEGIANTTNKVSKPKEPVAPKVQSLFSSDKASRAKVARQSANLVNTFGTALQVIAIIACLSILFVSTWLSGEIDGNYLPGFLVGLVISSILLFIYASLGALYRMIANYILFKTSDEG